MAKFTLTPAASFRHVILIPVAGGDELEMAGEFHHRDLTELREKEAASRAIQEKAREAGDSLAELKAMADFLMFILKGWEIPEEVNELNVIKACVTYPRFFDAVSMGYTRELWCLRQKP